MMKKIVTWDLGATKCAAAIVSFNEKTHELQCEKKCSLKLTSCGSLKELIDKIEAALDISMSEVDAVCIGAAGQYDGTHLKLEAGYPYDMCFAAIAKERKWPHFAVIHDYAPIVCATFTSYVQQPHNIRRLNECAIAKYGRRVALGVGTGLGLKDGVLFETGDFWLGRNEMGHIGIPTPPVLDPFYQKRHHDLIQFLVSGNVLKPNEPLTFERILTGQGTVNLFKYCYPAAGNITPEELGEKLRRGEATDVLALFAWYLGLLIGTVELTFMPEGGIWITGGVILNHLNVFDFPEFRQGIEASPSYLSLRQEIPLGVLCNHEHAFMGGAYFAAKRLL